jgi:hypothetical protein
VNDPFEIGKKDSRRADQVAAGAGAATVAMAPTRVKLREPERKASSARVSGSTAKVSDLTALRTFEGRRAGNEAHTEQIARSMKAKGYDKSKPITLYRSKDGTMTMGDGHHRHRAAARAGIDEVPIQIKDRRRGTSQVHAPFMLRRQVKRQIRADKAMMAGSKVGQGRGKSTAATRMLSSSKDFAHGRHAYMAPLAVATGASLNAAERQVEKSATQQILNEVATIGPKVAFESAVLLPMGAPGLLRQAGREGARYVRAARATHKAAKAKRVASGGRLRRLKRV